MEITGKNMDSADNSLHFAVDTPRFIREATENCRNGMYKSCWNVFVTLLHNVAVRASEINDPILNVLMLRLNLYDLDFGDGCPNISQDTDSRNRVIRDIENSLAFQEIIIKSKVK